MQGKRWLYSLLDEAGRSFRKENGLIEAKSDPRALQYTPDGWQDISIGWERNMTRYGTNRNFSLPFGFVRDGAEILRHLNYTKNFEQQVYLLIKKQQLYIDDLEYYWWYKYFYRGELDFTTFVDEASKVTINIMEGGTSKDLKANENTPYEIPVDIPEALLVKMDGINLVGKQNMGVIDGIDYKGGVTDGDGGFYFFVGTALLAIEGKSTGFSFFSSPFEIFQVLASEYNWKESLSYFIKADDYGNTINANIKGNIGIRLKSKRPIHNFRVRVLVVSDTNFSFDTLPEYQIFLNSATAEGPYILENVGDTFIVPVDLTIPLAPGERAFLFADFTTVGPARYSDFDFLPNSELAVNYVNRFQPTYIKALKPATLGNKLVEKITGKSGMLVSTLLNDIDNLVLTSGDALRRLPGSVIKANFSDFFDHINVVANAGQGIEHNKIVIERKEYFFNSSSIIPLGKVKRLSISKYTDILVNTIKYGWPDQDYDDVNGKNEFNTTAVLSTPIKRIVKELNLVSPWRADCYGIEFTRINLDGKTTTDSSSDNDVFVINVDYANPQTITAEEAITSGLAEGTIYYNLKRVTYDSVEGLIDPGSVFNIEQLSPRRIIEVHESWLRSIFSGFEADQLIFQTTEKNRLVKTVKGTLIYDEDAPINISALKNPILKPTLFNCEPMASIELVEQMEANPNRCFSFDHPHGKVYKGFNLKVGIAPNTLEEQAFQLISTFDNDLTDLRYGQSL